MHYYRLINSSANITAVGNDGGAGIGSGYGGDTIDISINLLAPGTINATGLQYVSGIGSGSSLHNSGTACVESNSGGSSRSITIRGTGIINAYGGSDSPGIGGENSCITIL